MFALLISRLFYTGSLKLLFLPRIFRGILCMVGTRSDKQKLRYEQIFFSKPRFISHTLLFSSYRVLVISINPASQKFMLQKLVAYMKIGVIWLSDAVSQCSTFNSFITLAQQLNRNLKRTKATKAKACCIICSTIACADYVLLCITIQQIMLLTNMYSFMLSQIKCKVIIKGNMHQ